MNILFSHRHFVEGPSMPLPPSPLHTHAALASLKVLVAALCLGAPLSARPAPSAEAGLLTESSTGVHFQSERTVGGVTYRCLGASSKRIFTFPIYAVAFCMEGSLAETAVSRYVRLAHPDRAGESLARALASDQEFFEALSDAPGEKLIELHFLRDVPRDRFARSLRKSLRKYVTQRDADRIAASVSNDVPRGAVALAGHWLAFENEPALARGLFRIWLGKESATPGIKTSIARAVALPTPAATP
jgi:hypothetical protein